MSVPGSRSSSRQTYVVDPIDSGNIKKGNHDSGFHEDSKSETSSPSVSSSVVPAGARRPPPPPPPPRKRTTPITTTTSRPPEGPSPSSCATAAVPSPSPVPSENDTVTSRLAKHSDSTASILSSFSGAQELYDIDKVLDDDAEGPSGPPKAPEPKDYEIPSDTELAEIIAIMSGLPTSTDPPDPQVTAPTPQPHLIDSKTTRLRKLEKQKSLVTRDSNGRLYEKRGGGGAATATGPTLANGTLPNGAAGKRYLQRQGSKSLDFTSGGGGGQGSWPNSRSASVKDLRITSGISRQSVNSLSTILAASKAGYIGPKKKKQKPKPPPPFPAKNPSSQDGDDDEYEYYEPTGKRSWKQRLKFTCTMFMSILLISACFSLLFIVPLVVDPIMVGLDAHFINAPVQCQTIGKRNATGASNCTTPTCREGCTADLMFCYFIDVVYTNRTLNSAKNNATLLPLIPITDEEDPQIDSTATEMTTDLPVQEGILLVNPMGCGYPPELNCTEFERKFGEIGYTFPCYFSQENETIVVPHYNHGEQRQILSLALGIPCSSILFSSILLYVLLRWEPRRKRKKKPPGTLPSNNKASNNTNNSLDDEEKAKRAANGALGGLMGNLTGLDSKMKKRNYAKYSSDTLPVVGATRANSRRASYIAAEDETSFTLGAHSDKLLINKTERSSTSMMNGHAGAGFPGKLEPEEEISTKTPSKTTLKRNKVWNRSKKKTTQANEQSLQSHHEGEQKKSKKPGARISLDSDDDYDSSASIGKV